MQKSYSTVFKRQCFCLKLLLHYYSAFVIIHYTNSRGKYINFKKINGRWKSKRELEHIISRTREQNGIEKKTGTGLKSTKVLKDIKKI